MRDQRERSHTKSGPGRYAGRGKMVTIRPMFTDIRIVKDAQQRLAPAIVGGNWQGVEYLSYAEHDQATRATMALDVSYDRARKAIIEARQVKAAA